MAKMLYPQYKNMFENKSNDYVCPSFPTCEGVQDDQYFQFLNPKSVGIANNINTLISMSLESIKIPVDSYNQNSIILGAGQYKYVTGGHKGPVNMYYIFNSPKEILINYEEKYITFEITLFQKFNRISKYMKYDYTGDIHETISIINSDFIKRHVPVKFSMYENDNKIKIEYLYPGHYFEINNLRFLYVIDKDNGFGGQNTEESLFDQFKIQDPYLYPNGAFKGIVLNVNYPPNNKTFTMYSDEEYILFKHVPDHITTYYQSADVPDLYIKKTFKVDLDNYSINKKLYEVETKNEILWDLGETPNVDESIQGNITPDWDLGDTPDVDESVIKSKNTYSFEETIQYIDNNNLWDKTSELYINTSADYNFLSGIIIYNPHNFPVKINYLMFT